jgi:uncharacterized linocin/CFP29 family protein
MDILRRELAPIADEAWEEIDEQARLVLKNHLSARWFVDVTEPKGRHLPAVNEGRLEVIEDTDGGLGYGLRKVMPLVETRIPFQLNTWELDNAVRGAEDVDLEPLEEAAEESAAFEDKAVYYGLERAGIEGLSDVAATRLPAPEDAEAMRRTVADGKAAFIDASIEGPYALMVGRDTWLEINSMGRGYPLLKKIREQLEGPLYYSPELKGAFMVSVRGGDMELTLGHDFSIGYEGHSGETVTLYLTEAFSFRVLEPAAVIAIGG